jgi:hypothetical protein
VTQFIFQIDSPVVKTAYQADNYLIEYAAESQEVENDLCIVYFSSNEIYYPNTPESFEYAILEKNRYEWQRSKLPHAKKHIFIRDIQKQWYLQGINATLNSPTKLAEFLKMETNGYRTQMIGSSAGGFGALLFGSLLEVERIYVFNAQLNLHVIMKNSNALTDPILFAHVDDEHLKSFYDLSNFIRSNTDNYYFQSCHSQMDLDQYNSLDLETQKSLKIIRFKTANHGFPFLRINLPIVLSFDAKRLESIVNKTFHPILFSMRLIGVIPTLVFVFKALKDRYAKKRLEAKFRRQA